MLDLLLRETHVQVFEGLPRLISHVLISHAEGHIHDIASD